MQTEDSADMLVLEQHPPPFSPDSLEAEDSAETGQISLLRPLGQINLRFLFLLVTVLVVAGTGLTSLHDWQVVRMAGVLLKQSERAEAAGKPGEAADALEQYLRLMPNDIEARSSLCHLLVRLSSSPSGRFRAFQLMEDVLRRDESRYEVRRLLIDLLMDLGRHKDAAAHLEYLLASSGQTAELHYLLGTCRSRLGDSRAAAESHQRAIDADPQLVAAYEDLAEILLNQLDQPAQADECMDQMVNRNADSHHALLRRSRYSQRSGKLQSALVDARRAYQVAPTEPDVLVLVSELVAAQSESVGVDAVFHAETVRSQLEAAAEQFPEDSRLYQSMAQLDLLNDRQDMAEQRIREGLTHSSNRSGLLLSLIEVLIARGKVDQAREEMARLREQKILPGLLDYFEARLQITEHHWLNAIEMLTRVRKKSAAAASVLDQLDLHLAHCYEQVGSHEQRLMALRRALQRNPASSDVRERLAGALAATGRVEEALAQYRQARQTPAVLLNIARLLTITNLEAAPEGRDWSPVQRVLDEAARSPDKLPDVLILRAEIAVAQQRNEDALTLLERACQRMPGEGRLWLARAELLRRQGNHTEAAAVIEETRQRLGDGVQLVLLRADHRFREADEPAGALRQIWQETLQSSWTAEERQRLLAGFADLHEQAGDPETARALRLELSLLTPESLQNWMRLLDLALAARESEQAEEFLTHVRRIDGRDGPYSRLATAALGIMLARIGDRSRLDEAQTLLHAAAQQLPNVPRVPLGLAQISELRGDEESAIEHYLAALARNARDSGVIRRVVTLLYRKKRFTEAQQVIQKLQDVDAFSLEGDFGRLATELSLHNQEFDHAVELARKTVTEDADDVSSRLWLAQVLRSTGRNEEAYREFQRVLQLDASLPEVWVAFASFLYDSEKSDEGAELLKGAAKQLPADQVALTLAQCWLALNRPAEAGEYFEQALLEKPDDVRVLWQAAEFYQQRSEPEKAVPLLQRILDSRESSTDPGPVDPELMSARRALARILGARGDWKSYSRALALVDENLSVWPHSATDQKVRARLLAGRSSLSFRREAILLLETAHQRDALSAGDQLLLTQLYLSLNNWAQGRDALLSLIYGHGDTPEHLAFGIRQMLDHGESDGIVEEWLSSLKRVQPDSFRTVELEARYLAATGEYDAAVSCLKASVRQGPPADQDQSLQKPGRHHIAHALADIAQGLDRIGRTVAAEKIFGEAEQLFQQAAEEDPQRLLDHIAFLAQNWRVNEAVPLCEAAWVACPPEKVCGVCVQLLRSPQLPQDSAAKILSRMQLALEQNPGSCPVVMQVAHAAHVTGNYSRAIDLYRRALACQPESVLVANELSYLLAVSPAAGPDALDEARRLIGETLERTGPVGYLLDTRGLVHLRQGRYRQALEDFSNSLEASPAPATIYHLAEAHLALGDQQAAQAALKKAVAQGLHADVVHSLERVRFREVRAQLERLPQPVSAPGTTQPGEIPDPVSALE